MEQFAMKYTTRLLLGLFSSLLLSAGFARAAAQFDPIARTMVLISHEPVRVDPPSLGTTMPCHYYSSADDVSPRG